MLERDSTLGLGGGLAPTARAAWYGGAVLLVLGLIGALVWLASDARSTLVTPVPTFGPELAQKSAADTEPRSDFTDAALLVDEPGDAQRQAATALPSDEPALPPLVLLTDGKGVPTHTASATPAIAAASAAEPPPGLDTATVRNAAHASGTATPAMPAAATADPVRVADSAAQVPAATAPTPAPGAAHLVDTAAPARKVDVTAAKSAEWEPAARQAAPTRAAPAGEAARTANGARERSGEQARATTRPAAAPKEKARPLPAAARTASRTAPPARARKGQAAPVEARAEGVDSDVALISAIIMHSSAHAAERSRAAAAGCGDKCDAKDGVHP